MMLRQNKSISLYMCIPVQVIVTDFVSTLLDLNSSLKQAAQKRQRITGDGRRDVETEVD